METHIHGATHVFTPQGAFANIPNEKEIESWRDHIGEFVRLQTGSIYDFPDDVYRIQLFRDDYKSGYNTRVIVCLQSEENELTIAATQFLLCKPVVVRRPKRSRFWRR